MGGSTTTTIKAGTALAGIQLQTSTYGSALRLLYGRNRVPASLIWHDDFKAIKHVEKQKSSGGKGGGPSVTTKTESWTYEASVMLALTVGPIDSINKCWADKAVGALNSTATGSGWSLLKGELDQAPWSWLTTKHPSKAIGYPGTALLANSKLDLGETGALKNFSFEVTGFLSGGTSGEAGSDAQPADIVPDFLANPNHGAGWDAARIADLSDYRDYCQAMGFFVSPCFDEQKPAREHLADLMDATNSDVLWSGGKLKVRPYGDEPVAGNGASYQPNVTPLYDLDLNDFIVDGDEDPVQVERKPAAEAHNSFPIEFSNRAQDYNASVVEEPDPVDAEMFGTRSASKTTLRMITRPAHAQQLSRIKAQRSVHSKNLYRFRLGWRHVLLEPMDLVTLTEPGLGLDLHPVRILETEEDGDGGISIEAEDWPFGIAHAALFDVQDTDGTAPDVNADPGFANEPVIFEPPRILSDGDLELWLATSGGELWGGCEIWMSTDNATYNMVGSINSPSRHGEITAILSSGPADDTTNTIKVALDGGGQMSDVSAADKNDLVTLSWVGGELIAYQTATLTAGDTYTLGTLKRGCYGTPITNHDPGSDFVRLDEGVFRYALPESRIGQGVYIKLVSFNVWGGGKQDIATVSPYLYLVTGNGRLPAGPTNCSMTVTTTKPS